MPDFAGRKNAGFLGRHFGKKCPNCGKKGFVTLNGTEELSEGPIENLGSTTAPERMPVAVGRVRDHYYCSSCKAEWTVDRWNY